MNERVVVPDYFVSPVPALWTIDVTGEAIEWRDHPSTAILLSHLQILCRALADQLEGLPPLSSIVFIVDALSRPWPLELANQRVSQLSIATLLRNQRRSVPETSLGKPHPGEISSPLVSIEQIALWLVSLQKLDLEFRRGALAHQAFLCELFEQFPRAWLTTQHETSQALTWLENLVGDRSVLLSSRLKAEAAAANKALEALDFVSMQAIDPDALRLRMRTGLDSLPKHEPLEAIERFPLAALAKELASGSDELGAVARLAQTLASTLSLPRLPSDPDVLPIGGVSDVTTRGQPDRLLMSELALDSDLLIARIANGQALYLRREQPPQPEPKPRCLIVETGVRMWGKMRLYSAAFVFGTCIAQERRGGERIDVVTVGGNSAWQEDFTTRSGLERFYARLLPDVHPGEAIVDLMQRRPLDIDFDTQPILVLSQATARDADFLKLIQDFPKPHLLACIEQEAWVELLQRSAVGDISLQRMKLSEVEPASRRPNTPAPTDVPLFLQQSPAPLRFSIHTQGDCVQTFDDGADVGCWVLTKDRRAMLLQDRMLGAIEAGSVPGGPILASHVPNCKTWLLIIASRRHSSHILEHLLVEVNVDRGVTVNPLKLGSEMPTELTYCFDRDDLIRVGQNVAFLHSRTGEVLASKRHLYPHLGGAFFGDTDIYVVTREDDDLCWRKIGKVPSPVGSVSRLEHGLPVAYARDLSWMTQIDGQRVIRPTSCRIQTLNGHTIVRVNANATEMLVSLREVNWATESRLICKAGEERLVKLSLKEPKVTCIGDRSPTAITAFETNHNKFSYTVKNVRTHISGLSFDEGKVILISRGERLAIYESQILGIYGLELQKLGKMSGQQVYNFGKPIKQAGGPYSRWKLRHAKLPRGDAWLDSRGMLHLRTAHGTELSLTLSEGMLSGWHSSGATFGLVYFTSTSVGDAHSAFQWLSKFARQQQEALT